MGVFSFCCFVPFHDGVFCGPFRSDLSLVVKGHLGKGHLGKGHRAKGHRAKGHCPKEHRGKGHHAKGHFAKGHRAKGHWAVADYDHVHLAFELLFLEGRQDGCSLYLRWKKGFFSFLSPEA